MIQVELIENNTMQVTAISEPTHGFFIFDAPPVIPPVPEFDYQKQVKPGAQTNTCWGYCRNGVPLELPAIDDCFGLLVVDRDTRESVQGYYTDIEIPAYEWVGWSTSDTFLDEPIIMPEKDWHLRCYVGYYRIEENLIHQTDYIDFTIKAGMGFSAAWLLLLLIPLLFLKKKT